MARLLLKVLKEIYEVPKAIQSIADGFITIFYHYPSVKEQIIQLRQTLLKVRQRAPKVSVAESQFVNAQQSVNELELFIPQTSEKVAIF